MSAFQKLFSVDKNDIREDVIITPFLKLEYFIRNKGAKINKGFLFEVLTEKYFSVVKVGLGSALVGDCVVYLKETACKRVYFIGSCGIISNFEIGDLIVVNKALAWESFSEVLGHNPAHFFINAESALLKKFEDINKNIKRANLATLGSLSLQEKLVPALKKQEIDVVDMEVSAFLSAAKYFRLQGLALLYATDIISRKPFFRDLDKKEKEAIQSARQNAITTICNFIQKINA